jgi:anti-sigma B factor antagonist
MTLRAHRLRGWSSPDRSPIEHAQPPTARTSPPLVAPVTPEHEADELAPQQPPFLTVTVDKGGGAVALAVAGEVDMHTAPRLHQALDHALSQRPRMLVIDLSSVRFLDCAGLTALVVAHRNAGRRTIVRVVAGRSPAVRLMRITGLDQAWDVYDSVADALIGPPRPRPPTR